MANATIGPEMIETLAPLVQERARQFHLEMNPADADKPECLPWDGCGIPHQTKIRFVTALVLRVFNDYMTNALGYDQIEFQHGMRLIAAIGADREKIAKRLKVAVPE